MISFAYSHEINSHRWIIAKKTYCVYAQSRACTIGHDTISIKVRIHSNLNSLKFESWNGHFWNSFKNPNI